MPGRVYEFRSVAADGGWREQRFVTCGSGVRAAILASEMLEADPAAEVVEIHLEGSWLFTVGDVSRVAQPSAELRRAS